MLLLDLPEELLLEITSWLSITDCDSLRQTRRAEKLQRCYVDRISIHKYLTRRLIDGKSLMKAMADFDVSLIGPRALECFVPGLIKVNSTWTFFAPSNRRQLQGFLRFMESKGAVWATALETLESMCLSPAMSEDLRGVLRSFFTVMPRERVLIKRSQFCRAALASRHEPLRSVGENFLPRSSLYVQWLPESGTWADSPVLHTWHILRGSIRTGGQEQTLELICGPFVSRTLQEYLFELPSSALQCFINGFGAVHMYGPSTDARLQSRWKGGILKGKNRQGRWINDICIDDFETSTLDDALHKTFQARDSFDAQAVFMPSPNVIGWPEVEHWIGLMTSCHMRWRQGQKSIREQKVSGSHPLSGPSQEQFREFQNKLLPTTVDEDYLQEFGL